MPQQDPTRLAISLRSAAANGAWNPTGWGLSLLATLEGALRVPTGDADQCAYRSAVTAVAASDMVAHARAEILDGLMPADVLDLALPRDVDETPAPTLRLAA